MHRHRVTADLDADVARDLAALAARRRVAATRIVETAVASFLSPNSADQTEAASRSPAKPSPCSSAFG
jgi:predicted transcriptional regulator